MYTANRSYWDKTPTLTVLIKQAIDMKMSNPEDIVFADNMERMLVATCTTPANSIRGVGDH